MVNTMINIIKTYLLEFESDENKKVPKDYEDNISNTALFAVVWSIGGKILNNIYFIF